MRIQATRADLIDAISSLVEVATTRSSLLVELNAIGIDVSDQNVQGYGKSKYTKLALGKMTDAKIEEISGVALTRLGSSKEETRERHEALKNMLYHSENTNLKLYFSGDRKPDITVEDLTRGKLKAIELHRNICLEIASDDYLSLGNLIRKLSVDFPRPSDLFNKMYKSIPTNSPQAQTFFRVYLEMVGEQIHLPALIPEFWLHYDPMTIKSRGGKALESQRCDFYMKLKDKEIIIEVDGIQHYANRNNTANRSGYAKQCARDRERILKGCEIYRFGIAEFDTPNSKKLIEQFFQQIFTKFNI